MQKPKGHAMLKGAALRMMAMLIPVAYGFAGFFLYRARVLTEGAWLDSDVVVIFGPFLIALLAEAFMIERQLPRAWKERWVFAGLIAFGVTFLAAIVYFTRAINQFGS